MSALNYGGKFKMPEGLLSGYLEGTRVSQQWLEILTIIAGILIVSSLVAFLVFWIRRVRKK